MSVEVIAQTLPKRRRLPAFRHLATSLGVLALAATLGLVAAQDRPAREPDPAALSERA